MESEKSYTVKEAKDFLCHIKEQHLNYCKFPSHAESAPQRRGSVCPGADSLRGEETAEASAWQYFEELSSRSKFLMLFHILNEKTFKTTVFDLLMLIKGSNHPMMNASFLCLGNHIEHVHETSVLNLGDSREGCRGINERGGVSGKSNAATGLAGNRMLELDPHFTWHPETSAFLLAHVTVPSSCGGVDLFPAHISNLQITPSSLVRYSSLATD